MKIFNYLLRSLGLLLVLRWGTASLSSYLSRSLKIEKRSGRNLTCCRVQVKSIVNYQLSTVTPGLHISEDVTRRAKDSRTELRRFTRELKLNDPDAIVDMEYDKLKVNGKRYTWSDAIHAVIDTQDSKVRQEMCVWDSSMMNIMMMTTNMTMRAMLELTGTSGRLFMNPDVSPETRLPTSQCPELPPEPE